MLIRILYITHIDFYLDYDFFNISKHISSFLIHYSPGCLLTCNIDVSYRTKEKGEPVGFNVFMKSREIKPTLFLRYVGNRFHVLFLMAGVVINHQAAIQEYLKR